MSGLWHLDEIDWLAGLTPDEIQRVERAVSEKRFDTGETIFSPTAEPRSVYLLKDGTVRIYRISKEGGEATFGYVRPGEVFGELAAVTRRPRESHAVAAAPSVVWRMPIELFRDLLGSRAGVGQSVIAQIGDRLKRIESRVEGLMFHDARERVATVLAELGDHFGQRRGDAIEVDGDFTQGELATLVGCSRQTLNQCLRELSALGLVEMKRQRIRLLKPDLLRAHSQARGDQPA